MIPRLRKKKEKISKPLDQDVGNHKQDKEKAMWLKKQDGGRKTSLCQYDPVQWSVGQLYLCVCVCTCVRVPTLECLATLQCY